MLRDFDKHSLIIMDYIKKLTIARLKIRSLHIKVRTFSLKILGLRVGAGSNIGYLILDWPKLVEIGENTTLEDGISFTIFPSFRNEIAVKIGSNVFFGRNCQINLNTFLTIRLLLTLLCYYKISKQAHDSYSLVFYNDLREFENL